MVETDLGPANTKIHESAYIDEGAVVGDGTTVWHFCHIMSGSRIGSACRLGQNVFVAGGVTIGNNVKIQNNVSVYAGVVIEDDVFCGPSCVFTNVRNPRSEISRHDSYDQTLIRRGATIGANATIICGVTVGRFAFVAAGAVVNSDVQEYALMTGVPARRMGWMSRHGHRLRRNAEGELICPQSGWRYVEETGDSLRCLDWSEDVELSPAVTIE